MRVLFLLGSLIDAPLIVSLKPLPLEEKYSHGEAAGAPDSSFRFLDRQFDAVLHEVTHRSDILGLLLLGI